VTGASAPVSLLILSALFALHGAAWADDAPETTPDDGVEVRIDTVLASNADDPVDPTLGPLNKAFYRLFPYSSYRLIQGEQRKVGWRREEQFLLPGGRSLVIIPRGIKNDRVSLNVMLIQGSRPLVNTVLSLKNRGTFLVGGPSYQGGVLIIAIGARTIPAASTVAVPAAAEVQ
jgi:hypothetical protein